MALQLSLKHGDKISGGNWKVKSPSSMAESALRWSGISPAGRNGLNCYMLKFSKSLVGASLLVVLILLVAATALPLVYRFNSVVPYSVFTWMAVAFLGLTAGLSARLLLGKRPFILRFSVALAAFIAGLIVLGSLTEDSAGLEILPHKGAQSVQAGFLAAVFGVLLLVLSTWNWRVISKPRTPSPGKKKAGSGSPGGGKKPSRRSSRAGGPSKSSPAKKKSSAASTSISGRVSVAGKKTAKTRVKNPKTGKQGLKSRPARIGVRPSGKRPQSRTTQPLITRRGYWSDKLSGLRLAAAGFLRNTGQAGRRASSNLSLRINRRQVRVKPRSNAVQPGRRAIARRKRLKGENVRFSGAVEHRCPYCLEEVLINDPRGVRICPVCATRHHRDCWNVTGTCQVPHE